MAHFASLGSQSKAGNLPQQPPTIENLRGAFEYEDGLIESYNKGKLLNLPNNPNPYQSYSTEALEGQIEYNLSYKNQYDLEEQTGKALVPTSITESHTYIEKSDPIVPVNSKTSAIQDTSVLFNILRKERQQEGTTTEDIHKFDEPREWDIDLCTMSLPKRIEDNRKVRALNTNDPIRNGAEIRSRHTGIRRPEDSVLPTASCLGSKSDDENRKRLSGTRNGDPLNRLKNSASTTQVPAAVIRTTKASRLRAAALGILI